MVWAGAMFGRVYADGEAVELEGGLNFLAPFRVSRGDGMLDITLEGFGLSQPDPGGDDGKIPVSQDGDFVYGDLARSDTALTIGAVVLEMGGIVTPASPGEEKLRFWSTLSNGDIPTLPKVTDSDGHELNLGPLQEVVAASGAAVDLVYGHYGKFLQLSHAAPTLTVQADETLSFPTGYVQWGQYTGGGELTIAGGVGVTVTATPDGADSTVSEGEWFILRKVGPNDWSLAKFSAAAGGAFSLPIEAPHDSSIIEGELELGGGNASLFYWGAATNALRVGSGDVASITFGVDAGGGFVCTVDGSEVLFFDSDNFDLEGLVLRQGSQVAESGDYRVGASWSLVGLNETLSADRTILTYGSGTVTLGGTTADTSVVRGTTSAIVNVNGTNLLVFDATTADFGAAIIEQGASPAASGDFRTKSVWRLAANTNAGGADVDLLQKDSSDLVIVGDSTDANGVEFKTKTGTAFTFDVGGTDQFTLNASTCTVLPALQIGASGGAYASAGHIRVGTLSSDATIMAWRISGSDRAILAYTNSGALVQIGSNSLDTVFRSEARWRGRVGTSTDLIDMTADGSVFRIKAPVVSNGSAAECLVRATGSNSGNTAGATLRLEGGRRSGSGLPGGVALFANVDDSIILECLRVGSNGSVQQLSFFGVALASQQADVGALTVSVGTADGTVADVGGSFSQTTLNNNFRDLADKINSIRTVLRAYGLTS